ncbi:MAG: dTDP-glucose 4,6-dehydratase [Acidimicrobiia bacterium]|nr:dTDP-glucose 4,6-dehydratase [Acidimicrobiia bacterium]
MKIAVTGGAGFIGSAFIRQLLADGSDVEVLNLDKLTYAGNLENLASIQQDPRYRLLREDICDAPAVTRALDAFDPDAVVHFAAESHVDRSILSPAASIDTNVRGTFVLLEAIRARRKGRFVHVSTDEVYGSIEPPGRADESSPLHPSSPYSASKAASDLLALSYVMTFGLDVVVTRGANTYGPYQFPEKLVPLMIANALDGRPLPVYGDGRQVRDWVHVDDHCRAIRAVLAGGRAGAIYNVSADQPVANIDLVRRIIARLGADEALIRYVTDRPGHDRRYAIASDRLRTELGWRAVHSIEEGLAATIEWYRANTAWVERVKSGSYQEYYERNYGSRTSRSGPGQPDVALA